MLDVCTWVWLMSSYLPYFLTRAPYTDTASLGSRDVMLRVACWDHGIYIYILHSYCVKHWKWRPISLRYIFFRVMYINSSPPGQNGCYFRRRHFQMYFQEWKVLYFHLNFTEGLLPVRPVHRRIYAALEGDELNIGSLSAYIKASVQRHMKTHHI